ncbi:MAG: leucine-rich repeat domain-containing protein, partial [Rikenellaceae bacterium]
GSSYAGGVVGYNNGGALTNCYNTGNISGNVNGSSPEVGGVVGVNGGTLTSCYWNSTIYSGDGIGGGSNSSTTIPMSTTEMQCEDFATTLNDNAYAYNKDNPDATQACGWIYDTSKNLVGDGDAAAAYPSLNIGTDPSMTYWTLSKFTSSYYPTPDTTWYISDTEATKDSYFSGLKSALATAYNDGKEITIVFSNLESLVQEAFFGWTVLTSISLPSAVTIGQYAFYNCSALTSISLPSATEIGADAFNSCSYLTSISLPSATKIGMSAFYTCSKLTSISLPSATEIGMCAFHSCTALTTLDLGSSGNGIISIGEFAFYEIDTETNVDLTIKISNESTTVSVDGNTLKYYGEEETISTTFKSITVVDND